MRPARLTAAALAAGAAVSAACPAAARDCRVSAVEGPSARMWHEGTWSPLRPAPLPAAAVVVSTGPGARAEIVCDDGVTVTIGTETEINLATLLTAPESEGVIMQLLEGVAAVVAEARRRMGFELRAPLAIASVRSTQWLMVHDPADGTAVFVREGAVLVRPLTPGEPVRLEAGEGVDVPPGGPPGPVVRWGQARIEALGARLGFGWR